MKHFIRFFSAFCLALTLMTTSGCASTQKNECKKHILRHSVARPICLDSTALPSSTDLAAFLEFVLDVTKARLNLADVLLDISFNFHSIVVQYHTGGFLDFAFSFFYSAFYLIFN